MTRKELLAVLNEKGIAYEITEHIPVYTIEEMLECNLPHPEIISNGKILNLLSIESITTFTVSDPVVATYEYCNLHGLWKKKAAEARLSIMRSVNTGEQQYCNHIKTVTVCYGRTKDISN